MIIIVWWWKCLFFRINLNCNFVAANVFGKPKTNTDFLPYNGDGFKLSIPSKWNPSKEREFPGQVLRYEDNFDSNSNVSVIITPTDKKSITDYGSPEEFLSKVYCGSFIAVTIIIHLWINFRLYASCCILSIFAANCTLRNMLYLIFAGGLLAGKTSLFRQNFVWGNLLIKDHEN